jgi:hypothetical protein
MVLIYLNLLEHFSRIPKPLVDGKMPVPKYRTPKSSPLNSKQVSTMTVNTFIFTTKSLLLSSVHSFVSGRVFSFQKQSQPTIFTH